MDEYHRSALQRSHVSLVQDLEPRGSVLDTLYEDGVLTENDCERITHAPTRKERCQLLLHLIPSRGPAAYGSFQKALQTGEYSFLANKLDHELGDRSNNKGMSEQIDEQSVTLYEREKVQFCDQTKVEMKAYLEACQYSDLREVINNCGCLILDNVEPTDVIDQLFQDGVITLDEIDDVKSGKTRRERCKKLMDIIVKKQNRDGARSLKIALTKKYKYIAQKITDCTTRSQELEEEIHHEELTEAKIVDRQTCANGYDEQCEEYTQSEILMHNNGIVYVETKDRDYESETDIKVVNADTDSATCNKSLKEAGINTHDGARPTQTKETYLPRISSNKAQNTGTHVKRKGNNTANTFANKTNATVPDKTHCHYNTQMVRYKEMAVVPTSQSHKRHRLTVAFNHLSTLINQGQFEKYESISTSLQRRTPHNHDLMCIIGYLNASRDLFKTDFDSAKKNINATMDIVPKTSNPRYFILELFTAKTRMYITQKKLEKLQKTLDEAMMILETDPGGCTGRAAGWLYINEARNKTAQMSCLNLSKENGLTLYEQLFTRAKTSFQRAMNNFQLDGGKDGPFGFGYALCRLVILLLRCGDNGLTMTIDSVKPTTEHIASAGQYIQHLEDSDIAIPKIMDMHFYIAKCDYQFRRGNLVRALQHAQEAFDLATELNMLEFTEHAHNRLKLLRGMEPICSDKGDLTEEEVHNILFGDSTDVSEISQSE